MKRWEKTTNDKKEKRIFKEFSFNLFIIEENEPRNGGGGGGRSWSKKNKQIKEATR